MGTSAKRIYNWAAIKANARFAPFWLGCIFLLELIFFLPLDAILVLFCLENPSRRYFYAIIARITSTLSGIAGYALGIWAWDLVGPYVINHLISTSFFNHLCTQYQQ